MKITARITGTSILVMIAALSALQAQQPKSPAPAPIPPQIYTAKKVFVSNAGGESFETVIDQTVFNAGPDRPYNQFYAAMKTWGKYEIVQSPSEADLILEVSWTLSDTGLRLPVLGQIRVLMIDPKTHVTLWNLIEYVRGAVLLSNRDKNFDQAMNTVVGRLKVMAVAPAAAPQSSK